MANSPLAQRRHSQQCCTTSGTILVESTMSSNMLRVKGYDDCGEAVSKAKGFERPIRGINYVTVERNA